MMRGYRNLKSANKLDFILSIKDEFTHSSINAINSNSSRLFLGSAISNCEIIVKQYLLSRVASYQLNKALLRNLGRPHSAFVHPLPKEWLKILESNGIKINYFQSFFVWNLYVLKNFLKGILVFFKILLTSSLEIIRPAFPRVENYVFFCGLTPGNLPKSSLKGVSYDLISWYIQWSRRNSKIREICHTVKGSEPLMIKGLLIKSIPSSLPPLYRISQLFHFIFWGFRAIILGLVDLILGRWWHPMLFAEASRSAQVRFQGPRRLAEEYFFHNSSWLFRPLWTYEAERLGCQIIFYFYSTNNETFKSQRQVQVQANSWQIVNWPIFLVWNKFQKKFIQRFVGYGAKIIETGPIWFVNNSDEDLHMPPNAIAVFDVQPQRDSLYQFLAAEVEYYVPETSKQFLLDIYSAIDQVGGTMVFKRKRNVGKVVHYKYRRFVDELNNRRNFMNINADISAFKVIEASSAVISMPFTSTALIAESLGKPSVYYDPLGVVHKDDRAAHGIPIITGPEELKRWLKSNI